MSLSIFIVTLTSFYLLRHSRNLLTIVYHLHILRLSFLFTTSSYYLFLSYFSTFFYFFLPVLAAAPDNFSLPIIIIFYKYFLSSFTYFILYYHYKLSTSFHDISMKSLFSLSSVCIGILFNCPLLFSFYMFIISSFSFKSLVLAAAPDIPLFFY